MIETPVLYLVDGSGFVFRAYHAIREPLATSSGLPTKAIFGFTTMLLRLRKTRMPEYVAVVFDAQGPSFRNEIYADYKANRKEMPDDLRPQWPYVFRVARALGFRVIETPGVEADDVIATLTREARACGMNVVVVSSDKDLMQLVGEGVQLYDTMGEKWFGPAEVQQKWGVAPMQLGDLLALIGDTSDNIPGIPGVGPKTATALLEQFGTLDHVLAGTDRIEKSKLREAIVTHSETARLARRLISLKEDVAVGVAPRDLVLRAADPVAIRQLSNELEFSRLLAEIEGEPAATVARDTYRTVQSVDDLRDVLSSIRTAGSLAVDTETTSLDPVRANLVGISLAWGAGQACYIPVGHRYIGVPKQLTVEETLALVRPLLEDPHFPKYGQNHKYDWVVLRRYGVELRGVQCDPMIASYLLDPSRQSHGLSALAREHLNHEMIAYSDVTGRGKKQVGFEEVDVARATAYSGEDADMTWQLARQLLPRVEQEPLLGELLHRVEIPLARVLGIMEENGVKLDVEHLKKLGLAAAQSLEGLKQEIHDLAGYPVNINSPVQLRELLFERLHLPVHHRTKSGPSTDADVLQALAPEHPIPRKLLDWRAIAKLKSTYMDALPLAVNPNTGRIHPSYNQAVAATGRLSASDPNVQNIPVRTELGREIRRAFVAETGCVLISCDYSQIELRVLAHLSEDPVLKDTFAQDQDVHARTAAEIFGVALAEVSTEMRRIAKTVVYGLSYGQTDYGLSQTLGISKAQAQRTITTFFERYPTLAEYLESLVTRVRQGEPAKTILGRRRFVPDIHADNRAQRGYAERIAKNTPIQGTAADIFKLAMLRVQECIETEGDLGAVRMLLTVHDELVFEVPAAQAGRAIARIRPLMETVLPLSVPLKVDVGIGSNWAEAGDRLLSKNSTEAQSSW